MSSNKGRKLVPANIDELKPYVPGKTIAEVVEAYHPAKISKLASNENRLGHSSKVDEAVNEALKTVSDYPDPVANKLKASISEKTGIGSKRIMVASGSESLLAILCRTFFQNKENLITADATFIGMFVQAKIRGVHMKQIPVTKDYRFDVKAMVNAIDGHTKMIYIANPNNPTGTYITKEEYEWMMEQVPEDVLVIMDEAYFEFTDTVSDYPDVLSYDHKNVIVLRTFSKAYGLAGFRIGYAIAREEIIQYMLKTKLTFEPGALAQAAALAAFDDEAFLNESRNVVRSGKERLYKFFDEQNIKYVRSAANFVMICLDTEEEAIYITQKMLEKGVILRRINAFGLPNCIRITIGLSHELDHFEQSFLEVINT